MIISFSSVKGGCGKSVSCVNLAYYIATKKNKKVLVVDLDCLGSATHNLGGKLENKFRGSIYSLLSGKCELETAIHHYEKGLDFIPADFDFFKIFYDDFEKKMEIFVEKIRPKYDFIFFDLTPAIYEGTIIPLAFSDGVIIPVDCPGGWGVLGLNAAIKLIEIVKQENKKIEILGILPNMIDRTKVSKEVLNYLKETYKKNAFSGVRKNAAIAQAGCMGKTVLEYRPKSNGAIDYATFGKEFLKNIKEKNKWV